MNIASVRVASKETSPYAATAVTTAVPANKPVAITKGSDVVRASIEHDDFQSAGIIVTYSRIEPLQFGNQQIKSTLIQALYRG